MTRPIGTLTTEPLQVGMARLIAGAPVVADSATLTDANISPTTSKVTGGAIMCRGLATIWVGAEITAPGAASFDLDPLLRDEDAADGARWKRLLFGATSFAVFQPTINGDGFIEIRVDGGLLFPRIFNVVGTPTQIVILARPGAPLGAGKGMFF